VEEKLDLTGVSASAGAPATDDDPKVKRSATVEVNGKRFDVAMWVPESEIGAGGGGAGIKAKPRRKSSGSGAAAGGSGTITAPMQGTIVKVVAEEGSTVEAGDTIVVLEAMKMENNITADKSGILATLAVEAGQAIQTGDLIAKIE
jgi:acetyl-CoA/propionyl-CoA carboxylase biotin carboxyl carrier protein